MAADEDANPAAADAAGDADAVLGALSSAPTDVSMAVIIEAFNGPVGRVALLFPVICFVARGRDRFQPLLTSPVNAAGVGFVGHVT